MNFYFLLAFVSLVSANIGSDLTKEDFNGLTNGHNFSGKVVLVTGSNSGIGAGIVKLFSYLGAQVVVTGRNAQTVSTVAKQVQQLSPKKLKPLQVVSDLTKTDDLNRLLNKTIETFGKLDILVSNAGIFPISSVRDSNFTNIFDLVIQTNLRSAVHLSHISVPYLEKTNGTIISISSIVAVKPSPLFLAYDVSKAGLDVMTRVLALELGPKIRVNTVNPGQILTDSFKNTKDPFWIEHLKTAAKATPLKRLGQVLDVVKGVVFLASTDASFITGTNLFIDGGYVYTH